MRDESCATNVKPKSLILCGTRAFVMIFVSLSLSLLRWGRFPKGEWTATFYLPIQADFTATVSPREIPDQPRVLHRAAFKPRE